MLGSARQGSVLVTLAFARSLGPVRLLILLSSTPVASWQVVMPCVMHPVVDDDTTYRTKAFDDLHALHDSILDTVSCICLPDLHPLLNRGQVWHQALVL